MNELDFDECLMERSSVRISGMYKCSNCKYWYPPECFYAADPRYRRTGVKAFCKKCDHEDRTRRNQKKKLE